MDSCSGGLGMAWLAMAQDGDQVPAILSRETQAVEKMFLYE